MNLSNNREINDEWISNRKSRFIFYRLRCAKGLSLVGMEKYREKWDRKMRLYSTRVVAYFSMNGLRWNGKGNSRIERAFSFEETCRITSVDTRGGISWSCSLLLAFFLYLSRETYTYNPALVTLVGASFLANLSMVDATGINYGYGFR